MNSSAALVLAGLTVFGVILIVAAAAVSGRNRSGRRSHYSPGMYNGPSYTNTDTGHHHHHHHGGGSVDGGSYGDDGSGGWDGGGDSGGWGGDSGGGDSGGGDSGGGGD